ncbi:unnamed protein product [Rotaria magnacalcarata]|uniref:Uncharacterized protein n=1 Tax=Rotaria magnacalcarata TaxID=392030 RepID=A0A816KKC9_9BILA|nr:unnamed protein product [Rotaria magnacalcarata]CAF3843563.1 unnamed protein product [Rotaria magnacalcarata]
MASYNTNNRQWQADDNRHELSNLAASEQVNTTFGSTNSIISQALPEPLGAPPGWHSEIIHSNSPVVNEYTDDYYANNTYATGAVAQAQQTNIVRNNSNQFINASVDNGSFHQQQPILTEHQQHDIIQRVERQNPLIVHKQLPNNLVTYQQKIAVRYLQPPPLPPPGPLIIREIRPPPPPPQSPIQIQQRPPPPPTPVPLILRERPPLLPPRTPAQIVQKLLPPPPPAPRRVIIERFPECPPKPADIIIERWLPYKQTGQRRILVERAPTPYIAPREPNLLILHDAPRARVHKEFINEGVIQADPDSYLQRYGGELHNWNTSSYLVDEAVRAVPPPSIGFTDHHYLHDNYASYSDEYRRARSPYLSSSWDRTRYETSIPRSTSYHYGYTDYGSPYSYSTHPSSRYRYNSYRSYDDYYPHRGNYLTMTDITPSWNRYCNSSYDRYPSSYDRYPSSYDCYPSSYDRYPSSYDRYPSSYDRYSSYYPQSTIRVGSDSEFNSVLSDLTHGRIPSGLH